MVHEDESAPDFAPGELPLPWEVPTKRVGPLGVPVPDLGPGQESVPADGGAQEGQEAVDGDPLDAAVEYGENYLDRVEEAIQSETCPICENILLSLRTEPLERQVQGVRELRQLKAAADAGADADDLADLMETFDVIDDPDEYL